MCGFGTPRTIRQSRVTLAGPFCQENSPLPFVSAWQAGCSLLAILRPMNVAAAKVMMPEDTRPGTETIVVVEDHRPLRAVARRILAPQGYTVLEAGGGAEALAIIRKHEGPIHLLLTDVRMPSLSGPELARQILAERPHIRVLYTSGYAGGAAPRMRLDADAAFLQKPYTAEVLLQTVRDLLDAPQARL
jgi:CheY-like chemotaxis protein